MKVRAKFMMQEHRQYGYGGGHVQHTFVFGAESIRPSRRTSASPRRPRLAK